MVKITQAENDKFPLIIITYDDATRMMDYCKDSSKNISREFFDWYLGDSDFFIKEGVLLMVLNTTNLNTKKIMTSKYYLTFDLTDKDNCYFKIYGSQNKYPVCDFSFNRQDNLSMEEVTFNLKYFNQRLYEKENNLLVPEDIKNQVNRITQQTVRIIKKSKGYKKNSAIKIKAKSLEIATKKVMETSIRANIQMFIYSLYATMYYVSKQEIKEVSIIQDNTVNQENQEFESEIVKSIYKYSGYINISNNKIFKPVIKKDPNEPSREYQRHIQAWSVRGHYRRTNNGLIWIDPYIKGEGEIEQRVYSSVDKNKLNLSEKKFEIERVKRIANKQDVKLIKQKLSKILALKNQIKKIITDILKYIHYK
ncbi:MAG: hypothetical protein PHW73_00650 [Atribacterota bacterium]|nr:hypothetical protein [Atribacterota bacterium]